MKSKMVKGYNHTKRSVDQLDHHLHDYFITRKRGVKYYKIIF